MRFDELLEKREDILAIAAKHGAKNVRVFGSVVRGEAGEGSDVDFLMDTSSGGVLLEFIALIQYLEDLLGCRVDIGSDAQLHRVIRDRVLREARPL
ncbi:MAG: nucleotidyltransferase family protein [Thermomicrobiales bacterium]